MVIAVATDMPGWVSRLEYGGWIVWSEYRVAGQREDSNFPINFTLTLGCYTQFYERSFHAGWIRFKTVFNQLLFKNYLLN